MTKKPNFRVFHRLNEAHASLFRASDQQLKANFGLGTSQLTVLFLLQKEDGQPISAIASALSLGKSALTGLISRMQEKGLVSRGSDNEDGRVTQIFITPAGRELATGAQPVVKHINDALLQEFDAGEQAVIEKFLRHLDDHAAQIVQDVHQQFKE
jgi:DNA-binding MarR family transcriptional regulator